MIATPLITATAAVLLLLAVTDLHVRIARFLQHHHSTTAPQQRSIIRAVKAGSSYHCCHRRPCSRCNRYKIFLPLSPAHIKYLQAQCSSSNKSSLPTSNCLFSSQSGLRSCFSRFPKYLFRVSKLAPAALCALLRHRCLPNGGESGKAHCIRRYSSTTD